ncbi:MAG: hypothetical protein U0R50_01215 [Gaiellales bacterium]
MTHQARAATFAAAFVATAAFAAALATGATQLAVPSPNLLANAGAEDGPAADGPIPVPIPSWATTGGMTVSKYVADIFHPKTFPGSGVNYFAGSVGPGAKPVSTATQVVDVSAYAGLIGNAKLKLRLTGMLGGYSGQDDRASLRAVFLGKGTKSLGRIDVAGPLDADRSGKSVLLPRAGSAVVPAGTRRIRVSIIAIWIRGGTNDGWVDNVSATLVKNR